jgi:uncharacterized protein (DUF1778 family)
MATSTRRKQDLNRELKKEPVLDEHERMMLVGADRVAFLAAVENPPEPTERLEAALRRHRRRL